MHLLALICFVSLTPWLTLAYIYEEIGQLSNTIFDFVIIGGGTAGAVLANRLTEREDFTVLVIEAGPTNHGVLDAMVPALTTGLFNSPYDWNYTTVPGSGINNNTISYPRGHILGGCSSHNGLYYTRGSSDDYDRWAAITGDQGWSWKNILPYMLKNERWSPPADMHDTKGQFNPSVHGFDGMMFTSLTGYPQPTDDMILEVSKQLPAEFPYLTDMNAGRPLGLGWYQGSIGNGTRSSSATAYLSSKFTSRGNLHVLLNTKVLKVHFASKQNLTFDSVEIYGSHIRIKANKELILSSGPINTPQVLLNSGIGDQEQLTSLGIPVILHLPSVGKNLTDQPFTSLMFSVSSNDTLDNLHTNTTLQREALTQWELNRTGPYVNFGPNQIVWARISSDSSVFESISAVSAGPNAPHIELTPMTGTGYLPPIVGGHFVESRITLLAPASRGSVTLNHTDLFGHPLIDLGIFTVDSDLSAMKEGLSIAHRFFEAPIWKGYIIEQVIPPANITTDEELNEYIRSNTMSSQHAVGTAAMSAEDAEYGVVNPDLLLKGARGLRIVDGSIMPFITAGHTQAPVYAIAERASDLIKQTWAKK